MTQSLVMTLMQQALVLFLYLSVPTLLLSLVVGLMISVFQAVTQIQEMTLTFIPKMATVFLALIVFGPWMLNTTLDFMQHLLLNLNEYAR